MEYFKFASLIVTLSLANAFPEERDAKIIGGTQVDIKSFPYQLFLNSSVGLCGASIISSTWALTAGHCLKGATTESISLRTGSSSYNSGGTLVKAKQFIVNPSYNENTIDYDLALIEVATPFAIGSSGTNLIKLANVEPPGGTPAVVSGWGRTSLFSQNLSPTLKATSLTIQPRSRCNAAYPGLFTDRMICANGFLTTACNGDSGGPLVEKSSGEQVGIVSYGKFCLRGTMNAFTNVANQRSWIKSVSGV